MSSVLKRFKRKLKKLHLKQKIRAFFIPEDRYQVYMHFFRLNRESGAMMVYNKKKSTIEKFRLELNNDKGQTFVVEIPPLEATEGHLVEYSKLIDSSGLLFAGKLRTVIAYTSSGIETFKAKGNKISRTK